MSNSTETTVGTDGYKPLCLPVRGEDLEEGRQYVLTPLARLILDEVYGLRGLPSIVECFKRKIAATRITSTTENLETGEKKSRVIELAPQAASFRVFLGVQKLIRFELDLAKLEELAPLYCSSHKLPAEEEKWFETHEQYPLARRLRGAPLRWWKQGCPEKRDGYSGPRRRSSSVKDIDLSILDI